MGTNASQVPMAAPPSKNKAKLYDAMPATKSKNSYGATKYEKKENKARCTVCIESKIVDGKPVKVFEFKHDDYMGYSGKQQPKEECYTDADAFGKMVTQKIKQIAKDLS